MRQSASFVPDWVADAIFYEIFPERFDNADPANDPPGTASWGGIPTRDNFFGGDLAGIRRRLPYLQELGVSALYLTPVFRAHTNHRYDIADYLAIDPALGDMAAFRGLVDEAHNRGMRIILDAVFNHCGSGFQPFRDLQANGAASPYAAWFLVEDYPITMEPPSYQTCGGTAYLPKLNTANPAVRDFLLQVARYWIEEAGIDGWRLDVPWKVPLDFWREFRAVVKAARPDAYIVGEVWRDARPWLRGDTCDGVMNYRLRALISDFVHDHLDAEDLDFELAAMRNDLGCRAGAMLNLLGSHDTPRWLTLCGGDEDRALLGLCLLMAQPGAPMIYYGDEIGLVGENDPGCRGTFPWDRSQWNGRILAAHRRLIQIRGQHPALRHGTWQTLKTFNRVYAFARCLAEDVVVVVANSRPARRDVRIPLPLATSAVAGLASGRLAGHSSGEGSAVLARVEPDGPEHWQPADAWQDLLGGTLIPVRDGHLYISSLPARSCLMLVPVPQRTASPA